MDNREASGLQTSGRIGLTWYKSLLNPLIVAWGRRIIKKRFSDSPIVIGGCDRSGTTLLISILGAHPHVYAFARENGVFLQWKQEGDRKMPLRPDRLYRYVIGKKIPESATRYCHKNPANILHIPEILDFYGNNVKFIQMVRDGRDVVTSVHPSNPSQYWVSVDKWTRDVKAGMEFFNHPNVHTIRYEDLISDWKEVMEKLCVFLEEPFSESLLDWHRHTNLQKANSWFHKATGVHAKSLRKWEKPEHKERLNEFMSNSLAVSLLKQLGYMDG